jgi:diadenosine tetraphosphatase ApaH/serine/threonine PP2A family protein phosphatase
MNERTSGVQNSFEQAVNASFPNEVWKDAWRLFNGVFDYMPVAAVVDNRCFCVNGGLATSFRTIKEFQKESNFRSRPFVTLPETTFHELTCNALADGGENNVSSHPLNCVQSSSRPLHPVLYFFVRFFKAGR